MLKELKLTVLWRPIRPSRTNTPKDVLFIIGGWNAKVGSQEIPGITGKFGLGVQNVAGQRLTVLPKNNALVIANTLFQQHKRRLYTWISPNDQYRNQIDYILCGQRWRSSIQSANTRPEADYSSDHELLIAKFRLNLKKVGKTTTIQVWPKSNPLKLYSRSDKQIQGIRSDRQSAWRTMNGGLWHYTGGSNQDHPQEKEMQKGKMVIWGWLTNSWGKKRHERQRRKGKMYPSECRVP